MTRIITLLTDFGTADGYVGEMKGVLAANAPDCALIDIAHDVAPHDVEAGAARARALLASLSRGHGASRHRGSRASAARARRSPSKARDACSSAPTTASFSPAMLHPGARCVALPIPALASPTFHGRDVFAPAAAKLAQGIALDALGAVCTDPIVRRTPEATRRADGAISGAVITIDRFGNLVTNLVARHGGTIEVAAHSLPIRRTYGDVEVGELIALVGSSGLVEIAVRDGSAAELARRAARAAGDRWCCVRRVDANVR